MCYLLCTRVQKVHVIVHWILNNQYQNAFKFLLQELYIHLIRNKILCQVATIVISSLLCDYITFNLSATY